MNKLFRLFSAYSLFFVATISHADIYKGGYVKVINITAQNGGMTINTTPSGGNPAGCRWARNHRIEGNDLNFFLTYDIAKISKLKNKTVRFFIDKNSCDLSGNKIISGVQLIDFVDD